MRSAPISCSDFSFKKCVTKSDFVFVQDAWFHKEYLGDFKQHFMKNFPYGSRDTPKHKKKVDLKR